MAVEDGGSPAASPDGSTGSGQGIRRILTKGVSRWGCARCLPQRQPPSLLDLIQMSRRPRTQINDSPLHASSLDKIIENLKKNNQTSQLSSTLCMTFKYATGRPLALREKFILARIWKGMGHSDPPGFSGGSDGKESACSAGDPGSISASGRSPGEGNGYLFQ